MPARVPDNLMYQKGQISLDRARSQMIRNQEKAVTGKNVNRPSDDPVAAMQISQLTSTVNRDRTISANLDVASNLLSMTDSSLGELTDVLSRAKELAIQMSSTTNQPEDARLAVREEVEQLLLRAVQIGNARLGDRYIFGGYQTNRPPFDEQGNYYGDDGIFEIESDRGAKMAINVPGNMPFFGISEIPNESLELRESPEKNNVPSISKDIRQPASIEIANRELDPENEQDQEEIARLESKSGVNVFFELKKFSEGLLTGKVEDIHTSIEGLDGALRQAISSRAMLGAKQNFLKIAQDSIAGQDVANAELKSQAEDADVLKVYSDLAKNENVLKSSLEINRKLITPTLLDFLK